MYGINTNGQHSFANLQRSDGKRGGDLDANIVDAEALLEADLRQVKIDCYAWKVKIVDSN